MLWIRNRVDAKFGSVFLSRPVTRSSPVLYREYCVQDGNLVPRFFLLILTLLLPVFTTHALLPIFPEESWLLEWIQIRVDGQIRFEYGYLWTWNLLNPERNSSGFKSIRISGGGLNERLDGLLSSEQLLSGIQVSDQFCPTKSLFFSGTSMQGLQLILKLKHSQIRWRQLFSLHRQTASNCFH